MNDLRNGPVAAAIRAHRLIVILRRVEPQSKLVALVDELAEAGARVFEITFDALSAADDVAVLKDRLGSGFFVGAGTLMTSGQVLAARDVASDFGVSAVLDTGLLRAAVDGGFPFVAGGLTPTELRSGWSAGATFVKLFPASAVGPQMIRELHGPLPEIQVIPTGGVSLDNAAAFLDAGAVAVGLGSAIARADPAARRSFIKRLAEPSS